MKNIIPSYIPPPRDGLMKYIDPTSRDLRFTYVLYIFIMLYLIFLLPMTLNAKLIMGLVAVIVVVVILQDNQYFSSSNLNQEMKWKLEQIDPEGIYEYLYTDMSMIDLLFSISDFKQHGQDLFTRIMKTLNNFYLIYADFMTNALVYPTQDYEVAESMARNAVNYLHSFIYNLPASQDIKNKLAQAIERMRRLLRYKLDEMLFITKQQPLTSKTQYVRHPDIPKPMMLSAPEDQAFYFFY